jgi:hypothetical protein
MRDMGWKTMMADIFCSYRISSPKERGIRTMVVAVDTVKP